MAPVDHGEPVEIRAFRGTRRTSVYRVHVVAPRAFARILSIGAGRRLTLLSSLGRDDGPHRLDKGKAQQLADEAASIRSDGDLLELDRDLTAIAEIARWCARAPGQSWMRIEGW